MSELATPEVRTAEVQISDGFRNPALPTPRGPISAAIVHALRSGDPLAADPHGGEVAAADPWGDDLQLALTVCQELHYGGWRGVDAAREWDPGVVALRVALEDRFLAVVDEGGGPGGSVAEELAALLRGGGDEGASAYLESRGSRREYADYFAARSIYHLKEGDPHAWVIPRLPAAAKAPFVAVEFDEFGGGRPTRVHQELYRRLLTDFGLDPHYLAYLDAAPAVVLAPVTLMTALGLRRARRGAVVGHFAATEITSSPGSARLLAGLRRLGAPESVCLFYREHVEADAVHEIVVRDDVIGGLLAVEPELAADVVAGIRAFLLVEDRLDAAFRRAWEAGGTLMGVSAAAA